MQTRARLLQKIVERLTKAGVQAAGGFVEQEKPWLTHENARERGALLLSSGELSGFSRREIRELEYFKQLVNPAMPVEAAIRFRRSSCKAQVFAHAHVRKQRVILKDVSTTAALCRDVNVSSAIKVDFIVDKNAALVRVHEPRNAV